MVNIQRLATNRQTFKFPSPNPGSYTFLDEVGFEFRDCGDESNKKSPYRSIGCDVLSP